MAASDLALQSDFILTVPAELGLRIEQRARAQHKGIAEFLSRALEVESLVDGSPNHSLEEEQALADAAARGLPSDVVDAVTYEAWFSAQVQAALDVSRPGTPNERVEAQFRQRRAELLRRAD